MADHAANPQPGHFATPFRFTMSYPGFMVIGTVFLFYLGGFLTGGRPARWLGSRLVGLAAALAAAPVLCRMGMELYRIQSAVFLFIPLLVLGLLIVLFIWAILASFIEREF